MSQTGRRLHERYDVELPVMVIAGEREIPGASHNISLGGMSIALSEDVAFGAPVRVRVELPALKGDAAELVGTVRWSEDGLLGVQFGSLRAKEVWALNQLFKDLKPST